MIRLDNSIKPIETGNSVLNRRGLILLATLLGVIYTFLVAIELIGGAFRLFNLEITYLIYNATSSPFLGLFIGILATSIFQSSSTVTSILVAIVATGTISIENAVPVVMGANIGTTVTSTLVSFGFFGSKKQFKRAVTSATVHDFFNILTTFILLPLEIYFGCLSKIARLAVGLTVSEDFGENGAFTLLHLTVKPTAEWLLMLLDNNSYLILGIGIVTLILCIKWFGRLLKSILMPDTENKFYNYVFGNRLKAFGWGLGITAVIQSSSVTTSLIVLLSAIKKLKIQPAFAFVMGANIGTTFTAIFAALTQSQAALAIAATHLFFNLFGVLIFFPKPLTYIPIFLAEKLASAVSRSRIVILVYMVSIFFLLPFLLIFIQTSKIAVKQLIYYQIANDNKVDTTLKVVITQQKVGDDKLYMRTFSQDKSNKMDLNHSYFEESSLEIKEGLMIIGKLKFPLKTNECLNSSDGKNRLYRICLTDKDAELIIPGLESFPNCLKYYQVAVFKSSDSIVYYFSQKDKMILQKETFQSGMPMNIERLRSIYP